MNEPCPESQLRILIIDDDQLFCIGVREALQDQEIQVFHAQTCDQGLQICAKNKIDIVLLDQQLPDGKGVALCEPILSYHDRTKIIFITAYPCFDNALSAIKLGAFDYLTKPIDLNALEVVVEKAKRMLALERVEQAHDYRQQARNRNRVLIGAEGGLKEVYQHILLAAENLLPVLITGETGTGKSMVARAIHRASPLSTQAFIQVNCAAIPEGLMESELFGHEKGAFTGASAARKGIFELADGGSLFLDEIGELPLGLQSKLLGVLDDHRVRRIGGQVPRHVHVRILAATNVDLQQAVHEGRFRQDLFYRLGVIFLHLPPLRERLNDLPALCHHLIGEHRFKHGITLTNEEMQYMMTYAWPGNVRELKNVLERAIVLHDQGRIYPSRLLLPPASTLSSLAPSPERGTPMNLRDLEQNHINRVLDYTKGNQSQAAKILGISRSTLLRKLATAPK